MAWSMRVIFCAMLIDRLHTYCILNAVLMQA